MVKESGSDRLFTIANYVVLLVIGLVTLFPLYYVFAISFTDPSEYLKGGLILFPSHWSLISYQYLLSTPTFLRAIQVSAFLAVVGTICSLLVTSGLAYSLSRKRLKGRRVIMLMILITLLFNPGIIPPYLLVRQLDLINSLWSLILPALTSGWYVLLMKGFFDSIPPSLEEAATIDGCNDINIWYRIILPLSAPAMAAFGLFYAVAYWNTFFTALLYINDFEKWPLQVLLQNLLIDSSTAVGGEVAQQISAERQVPGETLKMVAVVIGTVPILLVYPFLQKHFAKGAMVGSVKE
ncbi:carbohydrate ABC transporter permease [Paenibacillus sp. P26]|nr:carbohydrate ABC transporter permease [Paenibacillus sp. P26]UUZ93389.1 carbohydrate ABC transporter permease [Paenibacillus sp. P25]